MKKGIALLFLALCSILFTACPVGLDHPLGRPGTEKLNENLIGTWYQPDDSFEMKLVEIKKLSDFTMHATVLEKTENYVPEVLEFKGWNTVLDGKNFMFFQDANETGQFYLYCYELKGDVLTTWDVSLLVGGVDAVTSTEAFRQEVSASLKLPDCLTNMITWKRI
ncbi:MAG: hypothetical protein ACKVPJ_02980 [Chitinophagales bacterium]